MSKDKTEKPQQYNRPVTDEAIFKASKEIVVKFIEVGRVTPANFEETYQRVYSTVKQSVHSNNE
jgi:hypothetical protein